MADVPETNALRNDFEQLRKDFAALSEHVKRRSNDQVQAGVDKACGRFQSIGSEIEARPITSMVAAFGIGLLLGKIFSR